MNGCCCNDNSVIESLLREIRDILNNMWGTWTVIFNTIRDTLLNLYDRFCRWINQNDRFICTNSNFITFTDATAPEQSMGLSCDCANPPDELYEITITNTLPDTIIVRFDFNSNYSYNRDECKQHLVYIPPYGTWSMDARGNMRNPLQSFGIRDIDIRIGTIGESGGKYTHPNNKVYVSAVWYGVRDNLACT